VSDAYARWIPSSCCSHSKTQGTAITLTAVLEEDACTYLCMLTFTTSDATVACVLRCEICAEKCSPLLAQNGSPRCHFVLVREVCFDDCLVKAAPFYLKQTCFSTMLKTWRAFLGQCHVKHCIPAFDCLPLCRDSWVDLGWHASSDIVVGEESADS